MLCASSQQYDDVNILKVDEDTIFRGGTMNDRTPGARGRYAVFFRDVQPCGNGLTAGFTACHESGGVTLLGYAP